MSIEMKSRRLATMRRDKLNTVLVLVQSAERLPCLFTFLLYSDFQYTTLSAQLPTQASCINRASLKAVVKLDLLPLLLHMALVQKELYKMILCIPKRGIGISYTTVSEIKHDAFVANAELRICPHTSAQHGNGLSIQNSSCLIHT